MLTFFWCTEVSAASQLDRHGAMLRSLLGVPARTNFLSGRDGVPFSDEEQRRELATPVLRAALKVTGVPVPLPCTFAAEDFVGANHEA